MNRRYSWTSHSEDESDYQREPDWQEVKFPLKFPHEGAEEFTSREWSVEVTTPDQEIVTGVARVRRDQVNVRFQPFQEGVHQVQVLANGRDFCPPLYFDVLDDGSARRLASAPPGAQAGDHHAQRNRAPKKRRDRPSRGQAFQSDEEEQRRVVPRTDRRQRQRSESDRDSYARNSGYLPSESDQHHQRRSRASSMERDFSRPSSSALRPRREGSVDRPRSGMSSRPRSVASDAHMAVSPTRHTRSPSQSSAQRDHQRRSSRKTSQSPSPAQNFGQRSVSATRGVHRHGSSLSRQDSGASQQLSRQPSTSSYRQRSVSDTESLISRRSSFDNSTRMSRYGSRRSRSSSHFSSADEAETRHMGTDRRRTKTTANLHDFNGAQKHQRMKRYQSSSDVPRKVSAYAFGAVPVQAANPKHSIGEVGRSLSDPLPGPLDAEDYEVVSVPRTGESFIVVDTKMVSLRALGKSASGDQLVQSEDGNLFLVKHGRAFPMQQGYTQPSDNPAQLSASRSGPPVPGAAVIMPQDGKPRCCVCRKKATNPKKRAAIQGLLYCYKHFKELYFHMPPDSHKKFLFVDLMNVPAPGMPVHPRANFTGLSFKQFKKAQEEFEKYDSLNQGTIRKDMVFPIVKQLLLKNGIKERKLREYFNGPHYQKCLMDMQLVDEHEATELQFLNMLSLVTRELTRKWLQKVKLPKNPGKISKAWSTTALDTTSMGFGDGGIPGMSSKSYIGLGQNFTTRTQPGMVTNQSQGYTNPANAQKRKPIPRFSSSSNATAGQHPQSRKKPSQADLNASHAPRRQRTHSDMPVPRHRERQRSRSREPDDVFTAVHRPTHSRQNPGRVAERGQQQRTSSRHQRTMSEQAADRARRRREDPEGRSRDDVSPARSRSNSAAGKTTAVIHKVEAGSSSGRPRSRTSPTGPQPRTSTGARTREEALAARELLLRQQRQQQQQQQQQQKQGSTSDTDDSGEDESDSGSNSNRQENVPERTDRTRRAAGESRQAENSEESSEEEDDEEESSEEDPEQVLEESDEEGNTEVSEKEPEEMPITGNRMADGWMLY